MSIKITTEENELISKLSSKNFVKLSGRSIYINEMINLVVIKIFKLGNEFLPKKWNLENKKF